MWFLLSAGMMNYLSSLIHQASLPFLVLANSHFSFLLKETKVQASYYHLLERPYVFMGICQLGFSQIKKELDSSTLNGGRGREDASYCVVVMTGNCM